MEETGFFGSLFAPIENLLHFAIDLLYSFTESLGFGSYGLAIILLTIIIKTLLYPLTAKQMKSMKAMQMLQPKMKKIQEKYRDNQQMMQQKVSMTEATQQTKVLMVVLPLFIGGISLNFPAGLVLYWVTMNVVQIVQQKWLYQKDISKEK